MITINLTLLIEFGLFILFLWVANKMMFRPILRVMDEREEKITGDTTNAERDSAEAQMAEERFITQITDAHQEAARRLRHAGRRPMHTTVCSLNSIGSRRNGNFWFIMTKCSVHWKRNANSTGIICPCWLMPLIASFE